jgi:hypothetical protein
MFYEDRAVDGIGYVGEFWCCVSTCPLYCIVEELDRYFDIFFSFEGDFQNYFLVNEVSEVVPVCIFIV